MSARAATQPFYRLAPSTYPVVREPPPPPARPSKLLDRVREANRLRHGSRSAEKSSVHWIRRFIHTPLAVDGHVAASTQNQAPSALLFLYRHVLHQELPWLDDVVRAKRPRRLPIVLTREEVRAVITELDGRPRLIATLLYGSGLRSWSAAG